MAQVVPVTQAWAAPTTQAVPIATQSTVPPYRQVTLGDRFKAAPLWQKAIFIVIVIAVLGVGAFMFMRQATGCGCPAGYGYYDSSEGENRCGCSGTPFDCKYNCGDGNCFDQGEKKSCAVIEQTSSADAYAQKPAPPSGAGSSAAPPAPK